MSILINTINEQEEKVLIAFLDSLAISYRTGIEEDNQLVSDFIAVYNQDINKADAEIESGSFVNQEDVELLFQQRRKTVK